MWIRGTGWKKIGSGIRDKHPGSATLLVAVVNICLLKKKTDCTIRTVLYVLYFTYCTLRTILKASKMFCDFFPCLIRFRDLFCWFFISVSVCRRCLDGGWAARWRTGGRVAPPSRSPPSSAGRESRTRRIPASRYGKPMFFYFWKRRENWLGVGSLCCGSKFSESTYRSRIAMTKNGNLRLLKI